MGFSGSIAGYDPGGNDRHGVACLIVSDGQPTSLAFETVRNAQAAIDWFMARAPHVAIGIDTLTILSTGDSGWRPADRWLRKQYPTVRSSVVNPNYLQGSMALSGLATARALRDANPGLVIVETHPKVLYYRLTGQRYQYFSNKEVMNKYLGEWLAIATDTQNDHEWDATISSFAVLQALTGHWTRNLHDLPTDENESLVPLLGETQFFWPE